MTKGEKVITDPDGLVEDDKLAEVDSPTHHAKRAEAKEDKEKPTGRVGKIMRAIKELALGKAQQGVDLLTRRAVLKGLGATAGALAGAAVLGKIGEAQADAPDMAKKPEDDKIQKFAEEVDRRMTEIENNPDAIEKYFNQGDGVYWLLTLNFVDLIMGLANKNIGVTLAKRTAKLARKNHLAARLEKKEDQNFAKLATGAVGKMMAGKDGKYPVAMERIIGEYDEEGGFNKNFPHPNLYFAAMLNIAMAFGAFGEDKKDEAIHQLKETGIGVGLLIGLGSAADGISYAEGSVYRKFSDEEKGLRGKLVAENDDVVPRTARAEKNLISPTLKKDISLLAEVIGPAPFMAACNQFPLLAFGNADVTKIRLDGALPICRRIFRVFEGYSAEEINDICSSGLVENEVVKKLIKKHCRAKRKKDAPFSNEELEAVGEDYFAEIGLGLMSSTMDVTQGLGDVAPAVVGAFQSYGLKEMMKTTSINFALSFVNGLRETQLVAKRLGVPTEALLNQDQLKRVVRFWVSSVKNLFRPVIKPLGVALRVDSMKNLAPDERGAEFKILDGIGKSLVQILRTGIGGSANVLFGALEGKVDPSLNNAALDNLSKIVEDMKSEDTHEEEPDKSALLGEEAREKFAALAEAIREKAEVKVVEHKVDALTESLVNQKGDNPEKAGVIKALREAAHLLEHNPEMMDLLRFDYWEKHAGPTAAETTFVVTAQGLSLKGLEKILNKWVYGPMLGAVDMIPFEGAVEMRLGKGKVAKRSIKEVVKIGSSGVVHTGVSMVADNWADEILHANQLTSEVFLDPICKEFGFDKKDVTLDEKIDVTERWKDLGKQLDAKLVERGADQGERMKLAERLYDKFTITKYVGIWFAIFGGGEDTIGNSPHFRAFVDEIKNLITLNKSWADILKHFLQHLDRYIRTLGFSYLVGPMAEMAMYDNDFIPDDFKAAA